MNRRPFMAVAVAIGSGLAAVPAKAEPAQANLNSFQEVPTIASGGSGRFDADIGQTQIDYVLTYSGLESPVTQAHIHLGRRATNGGVMVFLCSNIGAPAGVDPQPCPEGDGEITGTLTAADVLAIDAQGFDAGSFAELVSAIRRNAAYVNVHTTGFAAGEVRGQVFTIAESARLRNN